jgi:hypothetical protein
MSQSMSVVDLVKYGDVMPLKNGYADWSGHFLAMINGVSNQAQQPVLWTEIAQPGNDFPATYNWTRLPAPQSAKINSDGKDIVVEIPPHQAVFKALISTTGKVTVTLFDSKSGVMRTPRKLAAYPLGATGKTLSFGAEKTSDENHPGFGDLFIHIDWETDIQN